MKNNNKLLPFNDINDLHNSYKSLLELQKTEQKKKIEKLKKHNIKFTKTKLFGLSINLDTVPDGVKIKDIIAYDVEQREKTYKELGIVLQ